MKHTNTQIYAQPNRLTPAKLTLVTVICPHHVVLFRWQLGSQNVYSAAKLASGNAINGANDFHLVSTQLKPSFSTRNKSNQRWKAGVHLRKINNQFVERGFFSVVALVRVREQLRPTAVPYPIDRGEKAILISENRRKIIKIEKSPIRLKWPKLPKRSKLPKLS